MDTDIKPIPPTTKGVGGIGKTLVGNKALFRERRRLLMVALAIMSLGLLLWLVTKAPRTKVVKGTVEEILGRMTLQEKVGQMVMAGFPGYELVAEANMLVGKHYLGGLMLSSRNIRDQRQVAKLTTRLQGLAAASGAGVPLLLAVDQEGGYVVRLREFHSFPGNMALGAANSPDLSRRVARGIGWELRSVGINMNFAPVVDVNSNPANPVIGIRSFGEDPEKVADLGAAFIAGLHEAGILATAKHFPGHGDTSFDSHIALPSVKHPRARLDQVELVPFRRAIAANVDAIMTAHVTFPAIEPEPGLPATLSERVLDGLLRQEMGFSGLIVTDAMEMKAIADNFGFKEAVVRAVEAGADIVLVAWPVDWHQAVQAVDALLWAANEGAISLERIDTSVRRILTAKQGLGLLDASWRPRPLTQSQRKELESTATEAAKQAVTLVRDEEVRLPLTQQAGRVLVIVPEIQALTGVEQSESPRVILASTLRDGGLSVEEVGIPTKPDESIRTQLVARARLCDTVVMVTYYAWSKVHSGQAQLVQELTAIGREPVVVALREPYDLGAFPEVGTFLAAYSASPETMQAVAQVLTGKRQATGRLPVSLPGLYPIGYRL